MMKQVRIAKPVVVSGITIVPLERVSIYQGNIKGRFLFYASKEPVGVVVDSPQGRCTLNICGEKVSLETYTQEVDGLQKCLDNLNR